LLATAGRCCPVVLAPFAILGGGAVATNTACLLAHSTAINILVMIDFGEPESRLNKPSSYFAPIVGSQNHSLPQSHGDGDRASLARPRSGGSLCCWKELYRTSQLALQCASVQKSFAVFSHNRIEPPPFLPLPFLQAAPFARVCRVVITCRVLWSDRHRAAIHDCIVSSFHGQWCNIYFILLNSACLAEMVPKQQCQKTLCTAVKHKHCTYRPNCMRHRSPVARW
jgi:hypothetical protein